MRLKSKKVIKYKGPVYDLKVDTLDTSYNVENAVVHNSSAGSLVCWLLQITEIDSIRYSLWFERFINISRVPKMKLDLI